MTEFDREKELYKKAENKVEISSIGQIIKINKAVSHKFQIPITFTTSVLLLNFEILTVR